MREEGLLAAPRKRFKVTTHSEHTLEIEKNIIDRDFSIKTPDTVWATDITYVRTWEACPNRVPNRVLPGRVPE